MLSDHQRAARYQAQTGRVMLTPRQRRRIKHKTGRQSGEAVSARESRTADRTERAARKHRSAPPVQSAEASALDGAAPGRVTGPNHNRKSLMKTIVLAVSSVLALLLGGFTASTASAAAPVEGLAIVNLGYNARGADSVWNRNKEYVDIKAFAAKDVKGLQVFDQWAKTHPDSECNRFTITSLPGVTEVDGKVVLPAGHLIRVHSGAGVPSVTGGTRHNVFMNSKCGFKGHIWNNLGDTAYIVLGDSEESFTYDFENGYTVRP